MVYSSLWVVLCSLYLSGYQIRIHLRVQILTISVSNFTFDTCYVEIGRSVKVIAGESRFVLNSHRRQNRKHLSPNLSAIQSLDCYVATYIYTWSNYHFFLSENDICSNETLDLDCTGRNNKTPIYMTIFVIASILVGMGSR